MNSYTTLAVVACGAVPFDVENASTVDIGESFVAIVQFFKGQTAAHCRREPFNRSCILISLCAVTACVNLWQRNIGVDLAFDQLVGYISDYTRPFC